MADATELPPVDNSAALNPGPGPCECCHMEATCFGAVVGSPDVSRGCDACCAHDGEGIWCRSILTDEEHKRPSHG